MLANNFLKNVPNDRFLAFDHFAGLFDGCGMSVLFKLVVNERLEQLECHFLGQSALMQFQFRPDDDNRTARIIDPLSEQILSETSLLTFQCS